MDTTDQGSAQEWVIPDSAALSHDPAFIAFAARALGGSELTDGLTDQQIASLASIGQLRQYAPADLICDEHERTDELYVVEAGTVQVWLDPSSIGDDTAAERRIATLQAGQTCGELALLDGGVRSARLRAGEHGARLMAFTRSKLEQLCENDTAIGYRLMRNLASALALRLRVHDMSLYSED